jgi:hypothetical protein
MNLRRGGRHLTDFWSNGTGFPPPLFQPTNPSGADVKNACDRFVRLTRIASGKYPLPKIH